MGADGGYLGFYRDVCFRVQLRVQQTTALLMEPVMTSHLSGEQGLDRVADFSGHREIQRCWQGSWIYTPETNPKGPKCPNVGYVGFLYWELYRFRPTCIKKRPMSRAMGHWPMSARFPQTGGFNFGSKLRLCRMSVLLQARISSAVGADANPRPLPTP